MAVEDVPDPTTGDWMTVPQAEIDAARDTIRQQAIDPAAREAAFDRWIENRLAESARRRGEDH